MSQYFNHHFCSNSDLKKIVARHEGRVEPDNIEKIYDFGTGHHSSILLPHEVKWDTFDPEEIEMLKMMRKTYWTHKDGQLARDVMMFHDFRREHEFYRYNRFNLHGVRCKTDGDSRKLQTILELKGLAVATYNSFIECIEYRDYDQGGAWYLNVATGLIEYKRKLIIGISKTHEDRLFKVLIDRDHKLYKHGLEKIKKAVGIWKSYGLK